MLQLLTIYVLFITYTPVHIINNYCILEILSKVIYLPVGNVSSNLEVKTGCKIGRKHVFSKITLLSVIILLFLHMCCTNSNINCEVHTM